MSRPHFRPASILLGASLANAAFCRLFGGDAGAMLLVFITTLLAFGLRRIVDARGADRHISFLLSAFTASMLTACGTMCGVTDTPQVALGASVLFLIPGVPMINSVMDVLTGYPLMAFSRAVQAGLLVICIGLGLAATLALTGLAVIPAGAPAVVSGLWLALSADGAFAAVAAMGFAMISNPERRVVCIAGLLAALGHSFRFFLLQQTSMGIGSASLAAALLIGTLSVLAARRTRIPGEFFSFLALLPMIPGMYAYGMVLSTMQFVDASNPADAGYFLIMFARNSLTVLFVMCGLSIGATAPVLLDAVFPVGKKKRD